MFAARLAPDDGPLQRTIVAQVLALQLQPPLSALDTDLGYQAATERAISALRLPADTRVWNGQPTSEFSAVVAVTRADGVLCSGIVVGKRSVLTASHCLCKDTETVAPFLLKVWFGPTSQSFIYQPISVRDVAFQGARCAEIFAHDPSPNAYASGDVALLTLSATVASAIRPVEISTKATDYTLTQGWIIGYGVANKSENGKGGLKRAASVVVASADCDGMIETAGNSPELASRKYACIPKLEMVAGGGGSETGRDSCQGDSGGPLLVGAGNAGNLRALAATARVIAVVSRGVHGQNSRCGDGTVFVRLDGKIASSLIARIQ